MIIEQNYFVFQIKSRKDQTTQACKTSLYLKIENKHLTLNLFNNGSLADDIVITWAWECLHLKFPIKYLFKSLGINCTCHQLHVSWCLGVNWRPLRSEDFPVSLLGPWGLCLVPCLLSPGVLEWDCVVGCRLLPESCSCTLFTGPAVCCMVMIVFSVQRMWEDYHLILILILSTWEESLLSGYIGFKTCGRQKKISWQICLGPNYHNTHHIW